MAIKRYSSFSKAPEQEFHHQMGYCHIQDTHLGQEVFLCRDVISIFYSPSQRGLICPDKKEKKYHIWRHIAYSTLQNFHDLTINLFIYSRGLKLKDSKRAVISWECWLVGFYGISTIIGYLMLYPLYIYIKYDLIWSSWVLWHIKHCWLFNAKSCLYIYIKYIR